MSEEETSTEGIEQIKEEMVADGWDYVGMEQLKETKFQDDYQYSH